MNRVLLHACLAHDDLARAAFDRWQREFDLDDIDGAGFMLLPLLEARLRRLNIEHPWRRRLQGIQRKHWLEQQLDARAAETLLRRLLPHDERCVLLAPREGDAALLDEPATIIVPRAAAESSLRIAAAAGCTTRHPPHLHDPDTARWRSSITLRDASGRTIVLRWRMIDSLPAPQIEEEIRRRCTVQVDGDVRRIHPDAPSLLLTTALRRPCTLTTLALACLLLREVDDVGRNRLQAYAARANAARRVAALLNSCDAVFAARSERPAHSPRLRTLLENFDAYAAAEGVRRTPAALFTFTAHYVDAPSFTSAIASRTWRRHDSA